MRLTWILLIVAISIAAPAHADSWAPPSEQTYTSADGTARVTVVPRGIKSPLAYFSDKVEGREPAGQKDAAPTHASATLERRTPDGVWTRVWTKPLVNEVAPVDVVVAPGGRFVVTFDNWHSMGFGDDALVIYDADGELLGAFSVVDLVGEDMFLAMPRSVSSIYWHGESSFSNDGTQLVLPITMASGTVDPVFDDPEFVELRIALANAMPLPTVDERWEGARARAAASVAQMRRVEAGRLEWVQAPLQAPVTTDYYAWAPYLREAFARVDDDWDESDPFVRVLHAAFDAGHDDSVARLEEGLALAVEHEEPLLLAATDAPTLAADVEELAGELAEGSLAGLRIYVAAAPAVRDRIVSALEARGADVRWIDPAKAIPQRPDRLKYLDE